MLNEYEIDKIMQKIQNNEPVYIYYVASESEGRAILNPDIYKSCNRFKVIKLKVSNIKNAYFEYMNFINNPDNYVKSSYSVFDNDAKYTYYYSYKKDESMPYIPSIIYGTAIGTEENIDYDPSPIKSVYTNNPLYGDYNFNSVENALNTNKLDWKYLRLESPINIDGIDYRYVTSNWYILDVEGFTFIEKPLINVKQLSSFFMNMDDAYNYIEQLEA